MIVARPLNTYEILTPRVALVTSPIHRSLPRGALTLQHRRRGDSRTMSPPPLVLRVYDRTRSRNHLRDNPRRGRRRGVVGGTRPRARPRAWRARCEQQRCFRTPQQRVGVVASPAPAARLGLVLRAGLGGGGPSAPTRARGTSRGVPRQQAPPSPRDARRPAVSPMRPRRHNAWAPRSATRTDRIPTERAHCACSMPRVGEAKCERISRKLCM